MTLVNKLSPDKLVSLRRAAGTGGKEEAIRGLIKTLVLGIGLLFCFCFFPSPDCRIANDSQKTDGGRLNGD